MPYQVNTGVDHAGVFHALGTVVSDADGAAILEEHPSSLTRIAHDDDLCAHMVGGCDHESHDKAPDPAPARATFAPAAASTATTEG